VRYLTVRLQATADGAFHPVGKRLAAAPSVRREALHHVELLENDTVVTFAEGSGDRQRYEELMRDAPAVEEFLVSGDERWMATSQFTAREPVRTLLEWQRDADFVVEWPIRLNEDGSATITYLGSDSEFQRLFDRVVQSAALDAEVIETGPYEPDTDAFLRPLTNRQQEVLEAAVAVGYYENPREATHDEVAEAVGIAPATAGDHLREIERRVFDALVR
jgi:hypothetical protein